MIISALLALLQAILTLTISVHSSPHATEGLKQEVSTVVEQGIAQVYSSLAFGTKTSASSETMTFTADSVMIDEGSSTMLHLRTSGMTYCEIKGGAYGSGQTIPGTYIASWDG